MRKWLAGFLAATTAFTMLSGSAASLMAEEPATEFALAGAGSGQDVTVHFGNDEVEDISIHVNPETGAEEKETLAGAGSDVETEVETEADESETSGLHVSYVDQFGDSIGEAYLSVPAPEFGEDGILNLTASDDYKPAADFAVWKDNTSKAIQYSYVKARIGRKKIQAIRTGAPEEPEQEAAAAEPAAAEEVSLESPQEEKPEPGTEYYYTYNNEEWTKLSAADTVEFVFTSGKQKEYDYEDDNIKVTATLQHAWAIPDGAQLKVTQITPKSEEYNYAAYMEALNAREPEAARAGSGEGTEETKAEEEADPFNEENTLLYDIAFIAVKYDENGNPVEGSDYEYEPVDGSVSMSVEFKESQLTKTIGAESAEDISVFHLPLAESAKEGADTTAQATDINASDILVETVSYSAEDVSLEEGSAESVSFEADSFSTFVFTSGRSQTNYWNGSRKFTMQDILQSLGGLTNFAVVAGTLNTGDHIEGNIRVKEFEILGNGAELNSGGRVDEQNNPDTFTITKTVKNGTSDSETFNFVIVDETTNAELKRFSITATRQLDGTVSGSLTFTKDGSNGSVAAAEVFTALITNKHLVRVFELDGNNQRVQPGGKNGTMTVTYQSLDSGGEGGEIGNSKQNYIGGFTYLNPETLRPAGSTLEMGANILGPFVTAEQPHTLAGHPDNYIYFGNDNDVCIMNSSIHDFIHDAELKTTIQGDLDRVAELSKNLAQAYNGDTETYGSKNIGSNLNVINLISQTGNLTEDLQHAGFLAGSSSESNVISGLLRRGEYLLINIDVGNRTNYVINGQGIYYDHENPQGNNGYSDLGNHIIYNLVSSNNNQHTFKAYDKDVLVADWSAGLLLAPKANVLQDSYWIGEIIANRVRHRGAEIHKKTTVSGTNREVKVDVINTYPDTTDTRVEVEKVWDGITNDGQSIIDPSDLPPVTLNVYRVKTERGKDPTATDAETYSADLIGTMVLNAGNEWKAQFLINDDPNLPVEGIENGIVYSYHYYIEEVPLIGFNDPTYNPTQTVKVTVDGQEKYLHVPMNGKITVHNELQITEVPVSKVWQDHENAATDGTRPLMITVHLYADGVEKKKVDIVPDENGDWSYTFENLPKYSVSQQNRTDPIVYTVTEDEVENYRSAVDSRVVDGKTTVTLTNTEIAKYSLPATGGEGRRMIYLMSITLIALAGAGLIMIRRRREMSR